METKEGVWVYNKLNDKFILLENQPFKSKWTASKLLKVSACILRQQYFVRTS